MLPLLLYGDNKKVMFFCTLWSALDFAIPSRCVLAKTHQLLISLLLFSYIDIYIFIFPLRTPLLRRNLPARGGLLGVCRLFSSFLLAKHLPALDFCIEGGSFKLIAMVLLLEVVGPGVFLSASGRVASRGRTGTPLLHRHLCKRVWEA